MRWMMRGRTKRRRRRTTTIIRQRANLKGWFRMATRSSTAMEEEIKLRPGRVTVHC